MAQITITIPDDRLQDFLTRFHAAVPNTQLDDTGELKYTRAQWPKAWIIQMLRQVFIQGEMIIRQRNDPPDGDGTVQD